MLNENMWNIFKNSGNINAYLYCVDCKKREVEEKGDKETTSPKVKVLQGL